MVAWPDIPGVTSVAGRPRLPRRPEPAAALLRLCTAPSGPRTLGALVDGAARVTGAERSRLEGLAGWLPLSRVARWEDDGTLRLHPGTSGLDLALRFSAWVLTQPVPEDSEGAVRAYAEAVVSELRDAGDPVGGEPWLGRRTPAARAASEADPLTARLGRLLDALDAAFLERGPHVRAVLLALLAGRHALLLGPPGTAKSMLARALCGCFRDADYFEYLLSRFTHPDELFGPVSIPGLKQEDYRRLTEGFLPTADVAFLDEIFKANSAILNSLLTLVNERIFHHGRHRDPAPLIGVIGASNELPDPEGGLGALYDRFLVRLEVPPLGDADAFLAVATGAVPEVTIDPADALTREDLEALRRRADDVETPPEVRQALVAAWRRASEQGWEVSDRRWRQAVGMLRVAAVAEGRTELDLLDLLLLEPVLAPEPERAGEVREVLQEIVAPRAAPTHDLRAQWALLGFDRVAPPDGGELDLPDEDEDWTAALARRRRHAERLLEHAEAAVARVADDRERRERARGGRLWLARLPGRVVGAHLEAARELSTLLGAAEAYRDALSDDGAVLRALVEGLPEPERRGFGAGVALRLRVPEADVSVGLTLTAERVSPPSADTSGSSRRRSVESELFDRAPELVLSGEELVGLVRGAVDARELVARLPAHATRNASHVLSRLQRELGPMGLPRPPELPHP